MTSTVIAVQPNFLTKKDGPRNVCCSVKTLPWYMYFSAFTANLLFTSVGFSMTWSSPVIPKLQSDDPDVNPLEIPITTYQVSILAPMGPIATSCGMLLMANISDNIGRKKTMMIAATISMTSYVVIAFSKQIYLFYIFCFINGIGISGMLLCVPVYNTEIVDDPHRDQMICWMALAVPVGNLLGYTFGPFTTVRGISIISAVPSLCHLVLSGFIPESPIYLATKGEKETAIGVLERLRVHMDRQEIEKEYEKLRHVSSGGGELAKKTFLDIFRKPASRKAFLLAVELCALRQLACHGPMVFFMESIFSEANSCLPGELYGVLVGLIQVVVYVSTIYLIRMFSRRKLLLFSSLCCGMALLLLGTYFYLKHLDASLIDHIGFVPIICVIVFFITYGVGLGPLTGNIISEYFVDELRAVGVGSTLVIDNIILCTMLFSFPLAVVALGRYSCFWFGSFCCFLGFVGVFYTLPNQSFSEIQKILAE